MNASAPYALLFPGQGAQTSGMGRRWNEVSTAARRTFERADAALGFPLSQLCFGGPAAQLAMTENAQPALLTFCIAALSAIQEANPELAEPLCVAGHSVGEYAALVAGNALDFEDAIRLVRLRGKAMQRAASQADNSRKNGPWMMSLTGGSPESVLEICAAVAGDQVLQPAAWNAPGHVVISGHPTALIRAAAEAESRGIIAKQLRVSAPFHSKLMRGAAAELADALEEIKVQPPRFPLISNADAKPTYEPRKIRALLVEQMTAPVQWQQCVHKVFALGAEQALEIGPRRVLRGFVRKIEPRLKVINVVTPDDTNLTTLGVSP